MNCKVLLWKAVEKIRKIFPGSFGNLQSSDVILLANTVQKEKLDSIQKGYLRVGKEVGTVRICLTPTMDWQVQTPSKL